MDELCINDSIVNHAFVNMLDWHPGLKEDEKTFFRIIIILFSSRRV
jgi:hypothetical protein